MGRIVNEGARPCECSWVYKCIHSSPVVYVILSFLYYTQNLCVYIQIYRYYFMVVTDEWSYEVLE